MSEKTCITCKWYEKSDAFFTDRCLNPKLPLNVATNAERLLVRGETATIWTTCQTARRWDNECSKIGKFWEPRGKSILEIGEELEKIEEEELKEMEAEK